MDDLIKALNIFRKYGNPHHPTHCEHDVMGVAIEFNDVSNEDKKALNELSFFEDDESGYFKSFKFGSC